MAEIQNKMVRVTEIITSDSPFILGQAENDPACEGCMFYQLLNGSGIQKCCHYILYTEHKRPCGPGKDCTARRVDNAGNG